ncbi:MAG: hypothetical protein ACOXZZ_00970 [Sphaerochaetaceae bacterium]
MEKQFYDKWAKAFQKLTPYKDLIKTLELLKSKNLKLAVLSDFPIENKLKAMGMLNNTLSLQCVVKIAVI